MVKSKRDINLLIKRNFISLCREEGIDRVSEGVFEIVDLELEEIAREKLKLFKREMDISGKRVLDKKVVESIFGS